jgi:alpha-ketoglutarate-dependent taurine dioxygenase
MDNETSAALAAIQSVFDRPELRIELNFEPGQIQFVNNRATGHARTEFFDYEEPERKRHLVRLWLRDRGKRGYRG